MKSHSNWPNAPRSQSFKASRTAAMKLALALATGAAASGNMNGPYTVSSGAGKTGVAFNSDYASKGHEYFDVYSPELATQYARRRRAAATIPRDAIAAGTPRSSGPTWASSPSPRRSSTASRTRPWRAPGSRRVERLWTPRRVAGDHGLRDGHGHGQSAQRAGPAPGERRFRAHQLGLQPPLRGLDDGHLLPVAFSKLWRCASASARCTQPPSEVFHDDLDREYVLLGREYVPVEDVRAMQEHVRREFKGAEVMLPRATVRAV